MKKEFSHDVHLEALGIDFHAQFQKFRDDGFVDNILLHLDKVFEEFGGNLSPEQIRFKERTPNNGANGICLSFGKMRKTDPTDLYVVIFYGNSGATYNLMSRAHEELHALEAMGRKDLFEKKLKTVFKNVDLRDKRDEFLANLGGFYALEKNYSGLANPNFQTEFFKPSLDYYLSLEFINTDLNRLREI